jgi:hypothetical protein
MFTEKEADVWIPAVTNFSGALLNQGSTAVMDEILGKLVLCEAS